MDKNHRPWRSDEPVIIAQDESGGFIVVPPCKVAAAGSTITFKFYDCDDLEVTDKNKRKKFIAETKRKDKNLLEMTLAGRLDPGLYEYDAVCSRGRETFRAQGGSPPGVIVDP